MTAIGVTNMSDQEEQKTSPHGGQPFDLSLVSLVSGFGVGWPTGAAIGEVGSAVGSGDFWAGFISFVGCSCSFFTEDL
jgi:hypothetical protein